MKNPPKPQPPDKRANVPADYKPAAWLITAPNRPPNSTTAVSHRDVLYAAIGRVLTAWEVLETLMAMEFQRLVGTSRTSALRAYGSILASGSRCDMLMAAAEVELADDALATFRTCIDDVRKLASVRNQVAHGVVVAQEGDKWRSDDAPNDVAGPFLLMAAPYNSQKFKPQSGPDYMYSLKEVEAILVEIKKMQGRVGALSTNGEHHKNWRFLVG